VFGILFATFIAYVDENKITIRTGRVERMSEFLRKLFSSDFMPHGYCYLWKPEIVWLHAASDGAIALSYLFIPLALVYFVRKRRDLPFHWMFLLFGLFILGCGGTHAMEIWTLWHGTYRLAGVIKAITAVASVTTAAALVPMIPRALLLPSPSQLRVANLALERENAERRRVEEALRLAHDELEMRVQQRTRELAAANAQLRAEIDERLRAEQELRKQADLLELAHDAILVRNLNDRITYWNSGAEEVYGWRREEALGQTAPNLLRSIYPSSMEALKEEIVRSGRWEGELTQTRRDGETIVVSSRWALQRDENGQPAAVLQINTDITERKRVAENLVSMQNQLAHMARVTTMGELAASIAHEINQPLAAVVTNGNACLRWMALAEPNLDEARAAVTAIIKQGRRASDIIARIRALMKKSPPQMKQLHVNDLIREVLILINHEVQRNRVMLRTDLTEGPTAVVGDRVQLQQVVLNLLMNAVEATSAAAESPKEVLVTSRNEASQVIVAVQDSGVGIDPENSNHLFNPFFTTKPHGMGMGLAISRSTIQSHGGRLWAASNPGRGATFQFTLPAQVSVPAA
jgi:PAS domain S-box-containing protein